MKTPKIKAKKPPAKTNIAVINRYTQKFSKVNAGVIKYLCRPKNIWFLKMADRYLVDKSKCYTSYLYWRAFFAAQIIGREALEYLEKKPNFNFYETLNAVSKTDIYRKHREYKKKNKLRKLKNEKHTPKRVNT